MKCPSCQSCEMISKEMNVQQEFHGVIITVSTDVTVCPGCKLVILTDDQADNLRKAVKDGNRRKN